MGDDLIESAIVDSLAISRASRSVIRNIFIGVVVFNSLAVLYSLSIGGGLFSIYMMGFALGAFALVFAIQYGHNPRKWWASMWGTEVALNYDLRANISYEERVKLVEDIETWTKTEIPRGDVVKVNPWRYHFRRKDQAMLFKMTWL